MSEQKESKKSVNIVTISMAITFTLAVVCVFIFILRRSGMIGYSERIDAKSSASSGTITSLTFEGSDGLLADAFGSDKEFRVYISVPYSSKSGESLTTDKYYVVTETVWRGLEVGGTFDASTMPYIRSETGE